jgi:hypothetical protein
MDDAAAGYGETASEHNNVPPCQLGVAFFATAKVKLRNQLSQYWQPYRHSVTLVLSARRTQHKQERDEAVKLHQIMAIILPASSIRSRIANVKRRRLINHRFPRFAAGALFAESEVIGQAHNHLSLVVFVGRSIALTVAIMCLIFVRQSPSQRAAPRVVPQPFGMAPLREYKC